MSLHIQKEKVKRNIQRLDMHQDSHGLNKKNLKTT